jgi:CTP synthase
MVSGINPRRNLVEIIELKGHPWFLGTQAHPEFQSKPNKAHPLFAAFIAATLKSKKSGARGSSSPSASKSPKAKAKPATRAKVK